jgi:NDP-sugar pyrophosphorylase family protein
MSTEDLSAVVLAGTHHWSRSSFEELAPRPLLPVALAPLISYSLRWLRRGGVRRATICTNGDTRAVKAALGDGRDLEMELEYYRDATPRGAAGCVRDAGLRAGSATLLIADGTAIPTVDPEALLGAHRASGAAATAVVHRPPSSAAPPTPGGVYVFERHVLDHVAESGFQDIKENLIPKLRRAGQRVQAHPGDGVCPQVFDAQTYLAVNEWMVQRLAQAGGAAEGMLHHPDALVEPGAKLVGPVQLGAGALVRAGATVIGPTTIGPGSTVGREALVARSVMWSRCTVSAGALVHASVLGDGAVIGPAARLFNAVHPHSAVPIAALHTSARRGPWLPPASRPAPAFDFRLARG